MAPLRVRKATVLTIRSIPTSGLRTISSTVRLAACSWMTCTTPLLATISARRAISRGVETFSSPRRAASVSIISRRSRVRPRPAESSRRFTASTSQSGVVAYAAMTSMSFFSLTRVSMTQVVYWLDWSAMVRVRDGVTNR